MNLRKPLLFVGLGAVGIGLYAFYRTQRKLIEDITFEVKDIAIVDSSYQQIKLLVTLDLINKSEVGYTISGYKLGINIDGHSVSSVVQNKSNQKVSGTKERTEIKVVSTISPQQLLETDILPVLLGNIGNADIKIKGLVGIKKLGIHLMDYPVDISLKVTDFL
jgi:hypothetical protein